MTNERTDIHRPSAILPADYEFVGFDYYGPEIGVPIDKREIDAHLAKTGGQYSEHHHGGTCHVCGASAFYVCVFHHAKSNEYIATGENCATKMNLSFGNMNDFRKKVGLTRVMVSGQKKAFASLSDAGIARAFEVWEVEFDQLPKGANGGVFYEERTIRDMVGKLIRYGNISEKQLGYLKTLLARIDQRPIIEAQRKAEAEAAGPAPSGRVKVTGIVLTTKEVEKPAYHYGDSDTQTKLLIKLENGSKVYGNQFCNAQRGDTIEFTATFQVSDSDPKFAFYKRPKVVSQIDVVDTMWHGPMQA